MPEVTIGGTVTIPVGAEILNVQWVEYDGRAWLTPLWIVALGEKTMRPLRIIAPRFAPGFDPIPGAEILKIFQQMPLTKSLLEQGVIPAELAPLVEVRENPDIWAPCPSEN